MVTNTPIIEELMELFEDITDDNSNNQRRSFLSVLYNNPLVPAGLVVTTGFLVKACKALNGDASKFNKALQGRILAQSVTVGLICYGAMSLRNRSYEKQIQRDMVTEIIIDPKTR
eukprot:sb/3476720/